MSYTRFLAMIATSTVVMYILMYSTAYRWTHVWWSETRFWMALYMGAAMAVIMLGFMLKMYENKKANGAIFGGAALVLVGALFLARSQATIGDVGWMKAMVPHHSIAILTTERVPVDLDASAAQGDTLYAILHVDTGNIGTFEFYESGTEEDQPLMQGGSPVTAPLMVQ